MPKDHQFGQQPYRSILPEEGAKVPMTIIFRTVPDFEMNGESDGSIHLLRKDSSTPRGFISDGMMASCSTYNEQ